MFPTFEIFGRTVDTYALSSIIGLLVCGFVACRLGRRFQISPEDIILLMVVAGVGILLGGHLLYGLTNLPLVLRILRAGKPFLITLKALAVCFGGSVFYGGLFGSLLAARWMTHPQKSPDGAVRYDLYALCIPLFHTFGRIGCFFGGCCYGIESRFGLIVYHNDLSPGLCGVRRFPVSLLEAACNLLIFFFLLSLFRKNRHSGRLIRYYLLCYAPVRFGTEFLRGDAVRGIWFGLSTSQWISLMAFPVALFLILRENKHPSGKTEPGAPVPPGQE